MLLFIFPAGSEAGSYYLSLLKKVEKKGYKIKYKTVYKSKNYKDVSYTIYYKKGKNKRVDTISHGVESRNYTINGKQFSCSLVNNNWQCYEASGMAVPDFFSSISYDEAIMKYTGMRKIAGE